MSGRRVRNDSGVAGRQPSWSERFGDRLFRRLALALGFFVALLLVAIVLQIGGVAWPSIARDGLGFLVGTTWDSNAGEYGVLPAIVGTLYSSILALVLGGLLGIAVAIMISQRFLPRRLEVVLKNIVDLLAAIPSVVYGLWGIFVVIPAVRPLTAWLHDNLGFVPIFDDRNTGPNMLAASLVLAIMILPTVTAISRDALASVPRRLHEAAYGLGATRWQTILRVTLPTASTGVFAALVLAFGRALGETMALAMLLGNRNELSLSLLGPNNTLAALIANTFPEAQGDTLGALMYAALVLLAITLAVNVLGVWIRQAAGRNVQGLN